MLKPSDDVQPSGEGVGASIVLCFNVCGYFVRLSVCLVFRGTVIHVLVGVMAFDLPIIV